MMRHHSLRSLAASPELNRSGFAAPSCWRGRASSPGPADSGGYRPPNPPTEVVLNTGVDRTQLGREWLVG